MLTEKEAHRLLWWSRFGSDSYPITKRGRAWWCEDCPKPFKTKKAATEHWENYIEILLDKKAGRL